MIAKKSKKAIFIQHGQLERQSVSHKQQAEKQLDRVLVMELYNKQTSGFSEKSEHFRCQ